MSNANLLRQDQLLPTTRWLALPIFLILLIGFAILYFWPRNTTELFAWTINPPMTPLVMGAGYGAGAFFWSRVFRAKRWHHVGLGLVATTAFTWAMGLATFLHWDRFNHSHFMFWAWLIIYVATPFLVPLIWLWNRHADPGTPDPDDVLVPVGVCRGIGVLGALVLIFSLLMFFFPNLFINTWPWALTPLTARVLAGWFILPGIEFLGMSSDPRWSTWRYTFESATLGFLLILIAVVRAWGDIDPTKPVTWLYVGSLVGSLVALPILYFAMENRRTRALQA